MPRNEDLIFLVKYSGLEIMDAVTKEVCVDLDFSQITNWGCSKDIFVYSVGDVNSLVKEYFSCPAATQMCYLLNIYASILVGEKPNFNSLLTQNNIYLNKNKRYVSTFM